MHKPAAFRGQRARKQARRHARKVRQLLREFRRARWPDGVHCPHCQAPKPIKWATFSGRQRYRCKACGRTFSDLTGTAAAYTKRLLLWLPYSRCMIESLTLRKTAARVGIHLATAFRWRHANLNRVRLEDRTTLSGRIQIVETWFRFSEKGKRDLQRSARPRGPAHDLHPIEAGRTIPAFFACDQKHSVLSGMALTSRPGVSDLHDLLQARVDAGAMLDTSEGPFSPYAAIARNLGLIYQQVPGATMAAPDSPLALVRAYIRRFRAWLHRFRGVATKYLANYLAWHRALEARSQQETPLQLARWPLGTHPTLPIMAWFPRA